MNFVSIIAGLLAMWLFCLVVVAGVWMLCEAFGTRTEAAVERFDRRRWR